MKTVHPFFAILVVTSIGAGYGSAQNGASSASKPQGVIHSVTEWGAVGDGVTDSTAGINAAMSALAASGGTLVFPAGIYLTSTGVTPSQTSHACVNVEGAGSSVTVIRATAAMPGVYYHPALASSHTKNQIHCHIGGFTLDGNGLALTAMVNAATPSMHYSDILAINTVSNSVEGSNAPIILGSNLSSGGTGGDYESTLDNVKIEGQSPSSTGQYDLVLRQTFSDSNVRDVILYGASGGSPHNPNTSLLAGLLYERAGGDTVFDHVHCYPHSQNAPFPTCIIDRAGKNTLYSTAVDGMTSNGIVFENTGDIAINTIFIYGGTGTPAQTWTNSRGFSSKNSYYVNTVIGANCSGNKASLTNWRLVDSSSSGIIQSYGPNACPSVNVPWTGSIIPETRTGSVSISSSTSAPVTFSTPMSGTPSACQLTPGSSPASTGQPFVTALSSKGFMANIAKPGTLAIYYTCTLGTDH